LPVSCSYETDLVPRGAPEAAEAGRMQEVLIGDNSLQSLLGFFASPQLVT
jgi:hypothetical protein